MRAGLILLIAALGMGGGQAMAKDFSMTERVVGLYVFHWYTATTGQTHGVWHPLEGRDQWDGTVEFWHRQVKDMMDANVDLLLIHLIDAHEPQRVNLFGALIQLREEGYDVPSIAPFLDPAITFYGPPLHQPHLDFANAQDRATFIDQYVRFYEQFLSIDDSPAARAMIATINGKPLLDVWGITPPQISNKDVLTRQEVETRLRERWPDIFQHGVFMQGIIPQEGLHWADAWHRSFVGYVGDYLLLDGRNASIKPGQWDYYDRFLARNGGAGYLDAWERAVVDPAVRMFLLESWNEYTEGTGLYEANTEPNLNEPGFQPHEDTWGPTPRHYIDLTAQQASRVNRHPARGVAWLNHELPQRVLQGESVTIRVTARNTGNEKWRVGRHALVIEGLDGMTPVALDAQAIEAEKYGGVFRGRPVEFAFEVTAPMTAGKHVMFLRMQADGEAFGDPLPWEPTVGDEPMLQSR